MSERYVVRESGDEVYIFNSVRDVLASLEAIDVHNGEYSAWTSDGIVCELCTDEPYGDVSFTKTETVDVAGLTLTLREYVEKLSRHHEIEPPTYADWSLDETIDWIARYS